jgi:hypothetical protein
MERYYTLLHCTDNLALGSSNADFQYNTDPYNTLPYWTQLGLITCNVDITLSDTTHFFFLLYSNKYFLKISKESNGSNIFILLVSTDALQNWSR